MRFDEKRLYSGVPVERGIGHQSNHKTAPELITLMITCDLQVAVVLQRKKQRAGDEKAQQQTTAYPVVLVHTYTAVTTLKLAWLILLYALPRFSRQH